MQIVVNQFTSPLCSILSNWNNINNKNIINRHQRVQNLKSQLQDRRNIWQIKKCYIQDKHFSSKGKNFGRIDFKMQAFTSFLILQLGTTLLHQDHLWPMSDSSQHCERSATEGSKAILYQREVEQHQIECLEEQMILKSKSHLLRRPCDRVSFS